MERTQQGQESVDPHDNHHTRSAHLLDRIQQDAHLLTQRALEAHPANEPFRMMRPVAEDLERVAVPLILAAEHCNQMLAEPIIERDIAMLRDTTHLCARIEAMVSQLEDTVRTLERLMERPMPQPEPAETAGDGSYERIEQTDRPSIRRSPRGLPPIIEV